MYTAPRPGNLLPRSPWRQGIVRRQNRPDTASLDLQVSTPGSETRISTRRTREWAGWGTAKGAEDDLCNRLVGARIQIERAPRTPGRGFGNLLFLNGGPQGWVNTSLNMA